MTSPDDRSGSWRADPAASASGGHVSPGFSGDPLFDPLRDPIPEETARWPSDPVSSGPPAASVRPAESYGPPPSGPVRRRRVGVRRVRRTIKHIDPLSVLKLSLFFYSIGLLLWLLLVAVLYSFVDSTGLFTNLEEVMAGLAVDYDGISLGLVEKWAFMIGLFWLVGGTIVNVFGAFLYNVAADLIGGIELTFVERE